jgi:hypothetical protein
MTPRLAFWLGFVGVWIFAYLVAAFVASDWAFFRDEWSQSRLGLIAALGIVSVVAVGVGTIVAEFGLRQGA